MIHLNKRISPGMCTKLQMKNYSSFRVAKKIDDKTYIIDFSIDRKISITFNIFDLRGYFPAIEVEVVEMNLKSNSIKGDECDVVVI